jgi:hypothetical protein
MSRDKAGSTRIEWNSDGGHNFSFSSRYGSITLDLHDFKSSMKAHPALVWQSFTQLFPCGYDNTLLEKLSHIPISSFNDDIHSPQSLFDRDDNQVIFSQYRKALQPLWSQDAPTTTYIAALGEFQTLLAQAITLQNGVAMRAFQIAGLKFAAAGNLPRNIYIDANQCYIGKPEAKQHFTETPWYHSYWGIHDQVGLAMILYLGIFRPLEIPTPSLATSPSAGAVHPYLFLTIAPNSEEGWTLTRWAAADVNRALLHETSPLKAEGRACRHFTKGFLRRFLSDKARQISFDLPLNNDFRTNHPRNTEVGRHRQLALSIAVQEMLGLRLPVGSEDESPAHEQHGFEHARHLVLRVYGLYGSDRALTRSKAEILQREMPFLFGDSNQNAHFSGDVVLVETAAAVIYGSSKPVAMQPIPFNGYPLRLIAISLAIVSVTVLQVLGCFRLTTTRYGALSKRGVKKHLTKPRHHLPPTRMSSTLSSRS